MQNIPLQSNHKKKHCRNYYYRKIFELKSFNFFVIFFDTDNFDNNCIKNKAYCTRFYLKKKKKKKKLIHLENYF